MIRNCLCETPREKNCPCDCLVHPAPLQIAAGLERIPRQIAGFPEFRRAMLAAIGRYSALLGWRARGEADLGTMLLEMWAYVADVQAFYDEVHAHEVYLRTARQRPSLRRLVQLLGYIPKPAVAASVALALLGEGRKAISVPAGTAFRSAAFDGEPPQVFELDRPISIHPLTSRWTAEAQPPPILGAENPGYLHIVPGTARLAAGRPVLVRHANGDAEIVQVAAVRRVATIVAEDGRSYVRVEFTRPLILASDTLLTNLNLEIPTQMASVSAVYLDRQLELGSISGGILSHQLVLVERNREYRRFSVESVWQSVVWDRSEAIPRPIPVTRLLLDTDLNANDRRLPGSDEWTYEDERQLVVHYGFVSGGTVTRPATTALESPLPFCVKRKPEAPADGHTVTRFLLEDRNERGVEVTGRFDFERGVLQPDAGTTWSPPLATPVQVYGNVTTATRGETVGREVLGSGDAARANQSFKLKKAPLTYISSPTAGNERGVASTLTIRVDGIRWREAPSFFGVAPDAQVYIVRQNDAGETLVTFGDGQRGARLPTGVDNVVASYRYGAGAASPPAGAITQISKPVKGLRSVRNPLAAYGGDDREGEESLRAHAPALALILGRAVSMRDMEAVAAGIPGVRAVQAEWRWHGKRQQPVVQIWYIGEDGIEGQIEQTLRNLTEPTTIVDARKADGRRDRLTIAFLVDERYLVEDVNAAVRAALMDTQTGLLAVERIGIGRPLYRSRIFAAVSAVEGVLAVDGLTWNGAAFTAFAVSPGAGKYFDFEQGNLVINGREVDDG